MKTSTFVFTELQTRAAPKARGFYASLFGWEYQDVPAPEPYALVRSEGEVIGGVAASDRAGDQWVSYIGVADVHAATTKARTLGATVEIECRRFGEMGTFSVLVDPTGARFALWQASPARADK
jgi:predicted enzyme related to lactoylglutathione lyase